jgi:hypothetical protein
MEEQEQNEEYNDNDKDYNEEYEPHVDDPDFCVSDVSTETCYFVCLNLYFLY